MQGDASGGLDVTLLVAVAALAPARVECSFDRRCPQQSVNPLRTAVIDFHNIELYAPGDLQGPTP